MLENLNNYWFLYLVFFAIGWLIGSLILAFLKMPSKEKLNQIKEWLIYAVAEAEKIFGSGTGQLKLRYVYDLFMTKFPTLAKFITFEKFSLLVDEALSKFKKMLETNKFVQDYVALDKENKND